MGIDGTNFAQIAEDAFKKVFSVKTKVDIESKLNNENKEESRDVSIDIRNTWVWVEGYKGTDKDMCCQGFQYEIGKKYQMPHEEVDECRTGYHLCLNMYDVKTYYPIGKNNRYFKVRALVRLSDKNDYGKIPEYQPGDYFSTYSFRREMARNKLVAAEIEFLEELSMDEILENTIASNWTEEYKKLAIELNLEGANRTRKIDTLTGYGYSMPFASYLVEHKKFDVAKAVGSQSDLSMDMKVLYIMQG